MLLIPLSSLTALIQRENLFWQMLYIGEDYNRRHTRDELRQSASRYNSGEAETGPGKYR